MHATFNLTEIALVVLAALGCGILLERIRQPAVLGYILAGVLLGPSLFALVESRENVAILAELGVLLLLFLIGLELSLQEFKKVWHISIICTLLQLAGSLAVAMLIAKLFALSFGLSVLLGCSIALSSTAVAVKMLEGIGELHTETGRLTIGILIAQDLAIVPIILVLRSMGAPVFDYLVIAKIMISVGLLAALILFLSRRESLKLPFSKLVAGHEELLPLMSLAFCFGLAAISGLIGLSAAYGAFLAGLILGNTSERHALRSYTKPIQSVLIMVFFLSIGLLMDLQFIWANLLKVVMLLSFITIGKSLLNIGILHTLGQPWRRSFLTGLLLAQMGEFAFLLTTVGLETNLIDANGSKLVISLAALSLAFSPFWLTGARRLIKLAPRDVASFNELLDSAYGKEIKSLGNVCKRVYRIFRPKPEPEDQPEEE